ncbi:MAG: hypothetical protein KA277_05905 [Fusobacteriaceae bacterium]|nr:hypothetical protein [Fusobacteriaceae bacterium]
MDKELVEQKQIAFEEDEIDLVYLLKTIYKNRKLIIMITLVTTLFGVVFALFALLQPKKYKSDMTFVEQKSSSSSSLLSSFLITSLSSPVPFGLGSGIGSGEGEGEGSSLTTVMESRKFRDKVAEKLKLREYILEISKRDEEDHSKLDRQDVANWLGRAVLVSQDAKTEVYKVTVELEDKGMATKIANAYYYTLDDYLKNDKLDKSKVSRQYLEKQVLTVEKELNEKREVLKVYEEEYNSVDIDTDAKAISEIVAKIKVDILSTESELAVAQSIYGEESVDIITLESKLGELKKQLSNLEKGTGTVKFIPLNDIPKIKYELEKLKQEIDATGEVYKVMKVLLELAKISEMYEQSLIELIDEAVIPKISSSTNPKLIVIISLVLGLFMGIFITFVKEFAKGIDWKEFKN